MFKLKNKKQFLKTNSRKYNQTDYYFFIFLNLIKITLIYFIKFVLYFISFLKNIFKEYGWNMVKNISKNRIALLNKLLYFCLAFSTNNNHVFKIHGISQYNDFKKLLKPKMFIKWTLDDTY